MTHPRYSVATLADMAAIPEEALPRFLAELPSMLVEIRRAEEYREALQALLGEGAEVQAMTPQWIDDGERNIGISASLEDGTEIFSAMYNRGETP